MLLVAVSVVLWLELLVRDAAIYVVVLMLPLVFATLVWPARRVWATRTAELLFALILSKFAVVAVLSLGGAALGSASFLGVGQMSLGLILVGLAATSPWVVMRLLPVTELASSLHGMRSPTQLSGAQDLALGSGVAGHHGWAEALPALMRGADTGEGPGRVAEPSTTRTTSCAPSGRCLRPQASERRRAAHRSGSRPGARRMSARRGSDGSAASPVRVLRRPPVSEPTDHRPLVLGLEAQLAAERLPPTGAAGHAGGSVVARRARAAP